MTNRALTLEEQTVKTAIELRRAGFMTRMARVAAPGEGGEEDT